VIWPTVPKKIGFPLWLATAITALPLVASAGEQSPLRAGMASNAAAGEPSQASTGDASGKALVRAHRVLRLSRCLELAEANYPKIAEARSRLDSKSAQERQALFAPFSEFTATAGVAMAPTLRGQSSFSPNTDVTLSSSMALAWQTSVEGVVPLYTFGKLTHARSAAAAQTKTGEFEVRKEINETRLLVRKAFYAVQLARDALALIRDAAGLIDSHLEKMTSADENDVDEINLLRLRAQRADLDARAADARKQEASAMAGLRFLTGLTEPFDVPNEPLRPVTYSLGPLSQYLAAAKLFRPEINMAAAGVTARRELLRLERARYLPDIGLALGARWSYAPEVTDQTNPYVRDGANFLYYSLGVVLRYKLDFLPQAARVDQAAAQLREMEATERFALGGVGQQVEEAYAEVSNTRDKLDATARAARYAQQWLIRVQQGIEVGTMDEEDLVLPAKEYALQKFAQMAATFEFNLAYAKLAQSTGWDATLVDAP
jgi:outer membrane protein TolC